MPATIDIQLFPTPAAFFDALFGPSQHNAHVTTRRQHEWLDDRHTQTRDAAERALAAVLEEMRRPTPTEEACAEVREWQRRRNLRLVA